MSSSITPCLWFDDNLLEAVEFWTGLIPNSSIDDVARYTEGLRGEPGKVMAVSWTLDGMPFRGINGGPIFQLDESFSIAISCADQAEVDRYWDALTADGGQESQCGWLKDRFGVSWQIVPKRLMELFADPNPARAAATGKAMMGMQRLIVADLEAAADAAG